MKNEQSEILSRLHGLLSNFKRMSAANSRFEPEREVAAQILKLIETPNSSTPDSLLQVLKSIENVEHYDGSAWFDLQIHVHAWIRESRGQ